MNYKTITKHILKYLILLTYAFLDMVSGRLILTNGDWSKAVTDAFAWMFVVFVLISLLFDWLDRRFPDWSVLRLFVVGFGAMTIFSLALSSTIMLLFNPQLFRQAFFQEAGAILASNFTFSLLYLVYLAIKRLRDKEQRLQTAEKNQQQMEIKLLEQQINPHFLFNNLSVLSTFIEKGDQQEAHHFLNAFARIYRYVITHKSNDFVDLAKELAMASDFIQLLTRRFKEQFDFDIQISQKEQYQYFIIPNTLHILLENIVKHNQGIKGQALQTTIKIVDGNLVIGNQTRPKKYAVPSTKTGLENLSQRYYLLIQKQIQIVQQDDYFKVAIPLISTE